MNHESNKSDELKLLLVFVRLVVKTTTALWDDTVENEVIVCKIMLAKAEYK